MTEMQLYNKRCKKHEKRMARKKPYGFHQFEASKQYNAAVNKLREQFLAEKMQAAKNVKPTVLQRVKNLFGRIF